VSFILQNFGVSNLPACLPIYRYQPTYLDPLGERGLVRDAVQPQLAADVVQVEARLAAGASVPEEAAELVRVDEAVAVLVEDGPDLPRLVGR
jgi:hypothetical protein